MLMGPIAFGGDVAHQHDPSPRFITNDRVVAEALAMGPNDAWGRLLRDPEMGDRILEHGPVSAPTPAHRAHEQSQADTQPCPITDDSAPNGN